MQSQKIDIAYLARLARLGLSDEEKTLYAQQLGGILEHIAAIQRVDVSNIEPTAHGVPLHNNFRQDVPTAGMPLTDVLRNAPKKAGDLISVPKIVE